MIYCGIDFSINSTGICIINKNKLEFISFSRKVIAKKNLPVLDSLKIKLIENLENKNSDEHAKLEDAIYTTNKIFELIKHCDIIGIEGLSFGSTGNRLAEISGYQYLLRKLIHDTNKPFYIYPPKTIKKFVGNGNYDKEQIISTFIQNEHNWLAIKLKKLSLTKHFKPIDDLIDAYYIVKMLKNIPK